jgi:hypothetical protein
MTCDCFGRLSVAAPARKVVFSGTSGTPGLPKPPIGRRGAFERMAYRSLILLDLYTVPDVRWPCDQQKSRPASRQRTASQLQPLELCGANAEVNQSDALHSIDQRG